MPWVVEALLELGGRGSIVDVCERIWLRHESDLRRLGDCFYTWQYDVRWAAWTLRQQGRGRLLRYGGRTMWELVEA